MCESIEQNKGHVVDWDNIQWDTPRRHVRRIQERIFRATRDKDWAKVKNLQKLLVRSHSARLLAVRRVTQDANVIKGFEARAPCGETRTRGS